MPNRENLKAQSELDNGSVIRLIWDCNWKTKTQNNLLIYEGWTFWRREISLGKYEWCREYS